MPGRIHAELTLKLCCEDKERARGEKLKEVELYSEHIQPESVRYFRTGKDQQIISSIERNSVDERISTDFPRSEN